MLDFLCIGAQKAGTSWLHAQLERHPQVAFPQGKEVHYWDWVQAGKRPDDMAWYRRKFADRQELKLGDMTPGYASLEPRWIAQIAEEYPRCRILYVLRNPIERAWSAARMVFDYSQLEQDEVDDDWFIRLFRSRASVGRGNYEANIRRWAASFPRAQIQILLYDDLLANSRAFLKQVAGHVGIDAAPFDHVSNETLERRINWSGQLPITPRLYAALHAQYAPAIESLAGYLQRDLSSWLQPPPHLAGE